MAVQTSYPGVYVQEIPSGVRTITGVSTSITLFIGQSVWGPENHPVQCFSFSDFDREFTSYDRATLASPAQAATPATPTSPAMPALPAIAASAEVGDLARAVRLFFLNGGTNCFVMRITGNAPAPVFATQTFNSAAPNPVGPALTIRSLHRGIFGNNLRVQILANTNAALFDLRLSRFEVNNNGQRIERDVENYAGLSMDPLHPRFAPRFVNYRWLVLESPTPNAPLPPPAPTANPATLSTVGTEGSAILGTDYAAAYVILDRELREFNLMVLPRTGSGPAQNTLVANASVFCRQRRAFLLMDGDNAWTNPQLAITGATALRTGLVTDYSALFFPNILVREAQGEVSVGASGAMAGLMARIDSSRGVWKAPAGTEADIRGISGIERRFSDAENGALNPRAVNTIRAFPEGIVHWGARTMAGDDDMAHEYKYIPVRRTALFIEESLYRGLKWVVFEPNSFPLWAQIRLNVGAFMHNLFRQGAFYGEKKQDAYFVKCDQETTTQNDINLGIVNILVGFAPLKPAEFVVIQLQQMAGQIQV